MILFSVPAPKEKIKTVIVPTGISNSASGKKVYLTCFVKPLLCNFSTQILYEKSPKILNGNIDNTFPWNVKVVFSFPLNFLASNLSIFRPLFIWSFLVLRGCWSRILLSKVSYLSYSFLADLLYLFIVEWLRSKDAKWYWLEKERKNVRIQYWQVYLYEIISRFLCFAQVFIYSLAINTCREHTLLKNIFKG